MKLKIGIIALILAAGAEVQADERRYRYPDFNCNVFEAPAVASFEDVAATFFKIHAKFAGVNVDYEFEFDGNRWEALYARPDDCAGIAADYFTMQVLAVLSDPNCDAGRMAYPTHAAIGNGNASQERDTRGMREELVSRCELISK